jgi:hypothetical protein
MACGRSTPNEPSGSGPLPPGYTGEWTGVTRDHTRIHFVVSEGDVVTSIRLDYQASSECTGRIERDGLALPVHYLDPPGPPPYDQPGFGYTTNEPDGGIVIAGHFSEDRRSADGSFALGRYLGCSMFGNWTATRQ